jgi:hypothetical protein
MTCSNPTLETQINNRLTQIHRRLAQIADIEAGAAAHGGYGANGEFDPERQRLIDETDALLNKLAAIGGSPKFQPRP